MIESELLLCYSTWTEFALMQKLLQMKGSDFKMKPKWQA